MSRMRIPDSALLPFGGGTIRASVCADTRAAAFAVGLRFATVLAGGCINFNTLLQATLYGTILEFVTDNDGVFDLFEDGGEAAAE